MTKRTIIIGIGVAVLALAESVVALPMEQAAYYFDDSTLNDATGNGYNLTKVGNPATYGPNPMNGTLGYSNANSQDDVVDYASGSPALLGLAQNPPTSFGELTIAWSMRPDPDKEFWVYGKDGGGIKCTTGATPEAHVLMFRYYNAAGARINVKSDAAGVYWKPEVWEHWAVTFRNVDMNDDGVLTYADRAEIILYRNGEAVVTSSMTQLYCAPRTGVTYFFSSTATGGGGAGDSDEQSGVLDDLRIWDVALSAEDIMQVYEQAPEPTTMMLLMAGLSFLLVRRQQG